MALEKVEPQVECLVYPPGSIRSHAIQPLAISDIFGGHLTTAQGETSDNSASGNSNLDAAPWKGQDAFDLIEENIDYISFLQDGTAVRGMSGIASKQGTGGFILKAREVPNNSVVAPFNSKSLRLPKDLPKREWRRVQGGGWSQRVGDADPRNSAIYYGSEQPDKTVAIETVKPLSKNEGFVVNFSAIGLAKGQKNDRALRVIWGNDKYSLLWRNAIKKNGVYRVELNRKVNGQWETWHVLQAPADGATPKSGATSSPAQGLALKVENIGGILVVSLGVSTWWFIETDPATHQPRFVNWERAPVRVNCFGVLVKFQFSTLTYNTDGGKPISASFGRTVAHPSPSGRVSTRQKVKGHWVSNASIKLAVEVNQEGISYTVKLKPGQDGLTTPIATGVIIALDGIDSPHEIDPLDLRPYLKTWDYSGSQPDVLATSELRCSIDRALLDKMEPFWRDTLQPFSPIELKVYWQYRNTVTGGLEYGEPVQMFEGYVLNPDRESSMYGSGTLSVVARCGMVRLQEPAGFINERYAPLDILFAEGGDEDLYGADCVKHLLERTFGEDVAAKLNGEAQGARALLQDGHYPLLSHSATRLGYFATVEPFTGSGFVLPPPFGTYLAEWIKKIAGYDNAVFYWGISPLKPNDGVVPIYGHYRKILQLWGETPIRLPDNITIAGDSGRLVGSVNVRYSPEHSYNEFVVWGKKAEGGAGELMPTLHPGGKARLPATDPNAPEKSWARTKLVQKDYLDLLDGAAQSLAQQHALEFEGREIREVSITLPRGDEKLAWGQRVAPAIDSDPSLGLGSEEFRVKRVNHHGDCTGSNPDKAFTTELICRPISAAGF